MTIQIGRRPSVLIGVPGKRAAAVGCDAPLCEKALEFPVNQQATDQQCKHDTIRYMVRHNGASSISSWVTDGYHFFCGSHASNIPRSRWPKHHR